MDVELLITKFNTEESGVQTETTPEILLEYAQQLQNYFSGTPNASKLEYYFGLAFHVSKCEGLLGFLFQKITDRSYDKVKEALFHLIQYVIVQKSWKSEAEQFYFGIKNIADMYWKNIKVTARLQQAALDTLLSLFNISGSSLDLVEFDAKELYLELLKRSEKTVYQPTVRGKMFHLMGILGSLGYDTFMEQSGWFRQLFNHTISTVAAQVESSDAHLEVSILHGCLKGLDKLLSVFNGEVTVTEANWVKFQEQLLKIVDPSLSIVKGVQKNVIKRREFQRAALELVANHAELFQVGMFKKHRLWFEDLIQWAKSNNADDNKVGRKAMFKFLEIIMLQYPAQLTESSREGRIVELDSFFAYFAETFKKVLNTKNANRIELSIAVRGFGMLSNLCSEPQQSHEMLSLIMIHVDNIIHELDSEVVDKYSGSISVLPTYLESVATILPSLKTAIPEPHLESIKKLTILLIRFFPDLSENQRQYAHISVQKLFDSFWKDHHLLCEPFIEQVYQQSLLHVVSSPTKAEVDILIESWNKSNPDSKKSAISQLGLKPVRYYLQFWKQLLVRGQSSSHEIRFDLLMQWIQDTIGKLDLTIRFGDNDKESDQTDSNLDPVQGATAVVIKDFQVFVNIVEFMQDLMATEVTLHQKFKKWIIPFTCDILGYIKTNVFVSGFYKILSVVFDCARSLCYFEEPTLEVQNLHQRLNVFFQGLGMKIQEFRDDLLFSVLELWLSLPDSLILTNFNALNSTLKTVFNIGKGSFPLALKGLDAVERWFFQKDFPVEQIIIIMNNIFSILKTYFMVSEIGSLEDINATVKESKKSMKQLIKKNVQASQAVDDATLKVTQLRILQFIGSFGQFIHLEEQGHSGLSKDTRFLCHQIPFQDCKPEIFIDDLLPRVLELCHHAVERQTRFSACEFFHTICLIFIGKSRDNNKEALFRQIFHATLKLGCDSDIAVRQLFNPLCLQTVHWFSKRHSQYGTILLDVLTESLSQNEDLNRRELSALCIGEYFRWSLKHILSSNETNTKARDVLKCIFAMGTHASSTYRQGAVMAFNSIYKDFREDTALVSEFSFNFLFSFLTSLKLSKGLSGDSLLISSTKQAIQHLTRIFTKKKDRFNTPLRRNFKPTTAITETPCLKDVVNWLVCEGGSEAAQYRSECLRLVELLCPITKGVATVEKCLSLIEEKNGLDGWIEIAESTGKTGASNDIGADLLTFLNASSTFYEFLFRHSMLSKSLLSDSSKSVFWNKLMIIFRKAPSSDEPISLFTEEQNLQLLEIFSRLKFASGLLDNERLVQLWLYSMKLSKALTETTSLDVMDRLTSVWLSDPSPVLASPSCVKLLGFNPITNIIDLNENALLINLKYSVWYRDMAECGLMSKVLKSSDKNYVQHLGEKLSESITNALFNQVAQQSAGGVGWEANNLSANQKKLAENYLVIGLCLGINANEIVDATFDCSSVSYKDGAFQLTSTKGHVIQKQLLNALVYCKALFKFDVLLQERAIKDVGEFIQRVLSLVKSNRILRKLFGESVFRQTLANWRMISINCDVSTSMNVFIGLLALNIDACRNSEELSSWWSGPNLMQARHLGLKQKAEAFGFVTVFASSRRKKIIEAIMKAINFVVTTSFKPEENWIDVEHYVSHIFRKILKVFEQLPGNFEILEPILQTIVKVSHWTNNKSNHQLYRTARDSVEKMVKAVCETDNERVELATAIYQLIISSDNKDKLFVEIPAVWKCFLLPAVAALNSSATKKFFKKHIYDILKRVEAESCTIYDWMAKTLSVNLLELMIFQTDHDFPKGKELADAYILNASTEEIASKSDEEKVKIVYRSIVAHCLLGILKSDPPSGNEELKQCITHCYQTRYNTFVAMLLVSNTEFKLFQSFLFRGKRLYERIMDDNIIYEFPVFIDETSHKLGVISDKHKTKKATSNLEINMNDNYLPAGGNLSGSSLAPEATSYDFTTSVTVAKSEFYQKIWGTAGIEDKNTVDGDTTELEWNEINQHACMFAYVETLKRLHEFYRTDKEEVKRTWHTELAKMLTEPQVSNSVKTFLVGGIINTPASLEPFADILVEPLIQLVLNDCFGRIKLNYFVQDILITLISWKNVPGAIPRNESTKNIIKYIVEGVQTEEISKRKDVSKHVLEILQNVVRYWVPSHESFNAIPLETINHIAADNANPADETSSLRLKIYLSILNGGHLPSTSPPELMKTFVKSFTSKYKSVYVTAAKCVGRLLQKIKEEASQHLESHVQAIIKKLESNSRTKASFFVETLTAIQVYFPEIMSRMRNCIMEVFPKTRRESLSLLPLLLKQQIAELSNGISNLPGSSPNCADEFYTDIESRGLTTQRCKTSEELRAALDLLAILVDNCAQPSRLINMLDWLSCAEESAEIQIKAKFADCLSKLYERLLTESSITNGTVDLSTKQRFLKIFIRLYADENEQVHEVVNRFWTTALRDWDQTNDLMLELFDLIGMEEHPLNVFLGLMLQRCRLSPDYSKLLFQEPLDNCQFVPFKLDTSWRLQNSSFQPMFAESLSSVQNFGTLPRAIQSSLVGQRMSVGKFGMNVLRATLANLQFTPTQQASGDSMEDFRMEVDQESFHFDSANSRPLPNFRNDSSKLGSSPEEEGTSDSISSPILKLRKKFYAQKDSVFYATRNLEVIVERKQEAKDSERSRVSGVKTVRSYRIGELPDILIRHSDVLNTLVKLAKQDSELGRQFLRLLFQGMVKDISDDADSRKIRQFMVKAKNTFERAMRNYTGIQAPDRPFSTLLMELCIINSMRMPCDVVLDICKLSNNQSLGILELEAQLLDDAGTASETKSKRSRSIFKGEQIENVWLGLAELYQEIEENDVLRNIFENVESVTDNERRKKIYSSIGTALHLEGIGYFKKASEMYNQVLQTSSDEDVSCTGKKFIEDSFMNCMAKLGDWDDLYDLTMRLKPVEDVFHNHEGVERFIPIQMLSGMQLALQREYLAESSNLENFNEFLRTHLSTEEGTQFFTFKFPIDVGAWLILEDEVEFPNAMLERSYDTAIRHLKNVDSLPLKTQNQMLTMLQKSSVLQDFSKWKKHSHHSSSPDTPTRQLMKNWSKLTDHQPLDLMGNYLVASFRDAFLTKMISMMDSMDAADSVSSIQEQKAHLYVWIANLGALHKNFPISRNYLERLNVMQGESDCIKSTQFIKSVVSSMAVFPDMFESQDWCERWSHIWASLGEMQGDDEAGGVGQIKVDLLHCLAETIKTGVTKQSCHGIFLDALGTASSDDLVSHLLKTSQNLIPETVGDAFMNPLYYNKLFALLKKITDMLGRVENGAAETMLCCTLRACTEQGSANEMLNLANIFPLLKLYPSLNTTFDTLVPQVPLFLFLPWIDQIVTGFKSCPNEYSCFENLISRLVKAFPGAFQLQYPEYLDSTNSELFRKALKAVVLPYQLHKSVIDNITFNKNDDKILSLLSDFQTSLQEIISFSGTFYGEYHTDYANELFEIVNRVLTEAQKSSQSSDSGSSTHQLSDEICNAAKEDLRRIQGIEQNKSHRLVKQTFLSLGKLSPFLENFHFHEHTWFEKPGLYENFKRHNVQEHPLIVSFHPTLRLYRSVSQPIKLTVITNDGKRSNFLAKLGDDIRQDRRIQQLLKMSNVLFHKDIALKIRNPNLDTYSCIPITIDFGLIEMIDNVLSLKEVMFDTKEREGYSDGLASKYVKWMKDNCGQGANQIQGHSFYLPAAKNVGRQLAEENFLKIAEALPKFMLRDHIIKKATNLQEYFVVRQSLVKSYGALCTVHWLLGIGDRHLDNCLLSMTTGKIVGIDFGRAFGASNFLYSIPEMVPFRLTPQLQNLMMPYSYKGLFRESCILVWNCLISASEVIVTVADVFIQEPTMEWLKIRQGKSYLPTESNDAEMEIDNPSPSSTKHFPYEIMKKKLSNHNPAHLIVEELKMYGKEDWFSTYAAIVQDERKLKEEKTLSTEDYIDVLLDMATDKNILSRMYAGWNSWV